jgi:hypothetical protein
LLSLLLPWFGEACFAIPALGPWPSIDRCADGLFQRVPGVWRFRRRGSKLPATQGASKLSKLAHSKRAPLGAVACLRPWFGEACFVRHPCLTAKWPSIDRRADGLSQRVPGVWRFRGRGSKLPHYTHWTVHVLFRRAGGPGPPGHDPHGARRLLTLHPGLPLLFGLFQVRSKNIGPGHKLD